MSSTSFATRKAATVERTIGGKTLSLESGRLAKQASGAVVVRLGDDPQFSDEELGACIIKRNKFHGEWNYEIHPRTKTRIR